MEKYTQQVWEVVNGKKAKTRVVALDLQEVQKPEPQLPRNHPFADPYFRLTRLPQWKLKGCPKCGGDLYFDGDKYTCLSCSRSEG